MPLDPQKKYQWSEDGNGKYTIYSVEIFYPHIKHNEDGSIKYEITEDTIKEIINNYGYSVIHEGYYPIAHLGHHNVFGDCRENVGYLDAFREENKHIVCDIIDLDRETIEKALNKRLPYRSVEYDFVEKKIKTLALLESQPPALALPIMILEDEPQGAVVQSYSSLRNYILGDKGLNPEEEKKEGDSVGLAQLSEKIDKVCSYMEGQAEVMQKMSMYMEHCES